MASCPVSRPADRKIFLADMARLREQRMLSAKPKVSKTGLERARRDVLIAEQQGDWIVVKKRLTADEQTDVFAGYVREMNAGERARLDPKRVGRTKIEQYLLAWSFVDPTGQPLELSALGSFDVDRYGEISFAIDEHEREMDEERQAEKNAQAAASTSKPSSHSAAS